MYRLFTLCIAVAAALALLQTPAQAADSYSLTTLEWPPYTGESLAENGASVKVAKAAFDAVGATLEVKFFPWQRAVNTAKTDANFIGYFPEYYAASIEEEFIFSDKMGSSPLGFIELKANPVTWSSLDDLKGKTIGVVSGYVNTEEFDAQMASGELTTEGVSDDATNIRKVAGGRIDMAVIDKNVYEYLISTNPELQSLASTIQFNDKLLEDKGLFVCFRKSPEGEQAAAAFNQGVKMIDFNAIQDEYFAKALGN